MTTIVYAFILLNLFADNVDIGTDDVPISATISPYFIIIPKTVAFTAISGTCNIVVTSIDRLLSIVST